MRGLPSEHSFSVLLSTYTQENPLYIDDTLRSIYDEQCLKPAQIVLVLDGLLTAEHHSILDQWKNTLGDKLILVPLPTNQGLAQALNEGLKYCTHDLIARMDTDDVALPGRFRQQVSFMLAHPEIAVSSGQV